MKFDYYATLRSVCQEDYFYFVKFFWNTIIREPLKVNWHIPYLCREIQDCSERVLNKQPKLYDEVINISPGTSKSTLYSVMLLPWLWTRDPSIRMIGASYTEALALDLSGKSRLIVDSPLYKACWPHIKLRGDTNNKGHWANTSGGERFAVGVGGSVTGRHAHVIVIDDPLNPTSIRSKADIETANIWCKETISSRKVNKAVSMTFVVMQRLAMNDPTALYLERDDVKHICLPGELTDNVQPPELAKNYVDGLFDPERMSRPILQKMEEEMGQFGYAGQILQRPTPLAGGMFKPDRLVEEDYAPPDSEFIKIVRGWDRAASANKGDWTVGVKLGLHKDGTFWILDVCRGQWATDKREDWIAKIATNDGRGVTIAIEQEPGSSGIDSAKATLKRLAGYRAVAQPATGKKEVRADTFSVQVNAGNVHIVKGPYLADYKAEMAFFPQSTHDDQIDASSLAFSHLNKSKTRLGLL